jgi:protein-tyrosine phosphatase
VKKILFVCTGNICRSPTAEAIARHKSGELGLENKFIFDSAGIEGFHSGESPDPRTVDVARVRGVSFGGIFSRKIQKNDFEKFDLLMAMDRGHHEDLLRISPSQHKDKVKLFLQFCEVKNSWNDDVIDPYYKTNKAFIEVFDIIDLAIEKLLQKTV